MNLENGTMLTSIQLAIPLPNDQSPVTNDNNVLKEYNVFIYCLKR